MKRQQLVPRDVRELVARLGLPKPIWYVGRLNGEPGNYRAALKAKRADRP